jgi:hypothetical protein
LVTLLIAGGAVRLVISIQLKKKFPILTKREDVGIYLEIILRMRK